MLAGRNKADPLALILLLLSSDPRCIHPGVFEFRPGMTIGLWSNGEVGRRRQTTIAKSSISQRRFAFQSEAPLRGNIAGSCEIAEIPAQGEQNGAHSSTQTRET